MSWLVDYLNCFISVLSIVQMLYFLSLIANTGAIAFAS